MIPVQIMKCSKIEHRHDIQQNYLFKERNNKRHPMLNSKAAVQYAMVLWLQKQQQQVNDSFAQ